MVISTAETKKGKFLWFCIKVEPQHAVAPQVLVCTRILDHFLGVNPIKKDLLREYQWGIKGQTPG